MRISPLCEAFGAASIAAAASVELAAGIPDIEKAAIWLLFQSYTYVFGARDCGTRLFEGLKFLAAIPVVDDPSDGLELVHADLDGLRAEAHRRASFKRAVRGVHGG